MISTSSVIRYAESESKGMTVNDLGWTVRASCNGEPSLEIETGCSRFWHPRGLLGEAVNRNVDDMRPPIRE